MEPGGSLPCSEKPAIGPYPESDESSPQLTDYLPTYLPTYLPN
jgi:hypothetical protein